MLPDVEVRAPHLVEGFEVYGLGFGGLELEVWVWVFGV